MNNRILNMFMGIPLMCLPHSILATEHDVLSKEAISQNILQKRTSNLISDEALLALSKVPATLDLLTLEKHAQATSYGSYFPSPLKEFCDLTLALREVPHYHLSVLINDDMDLGQSIHRELGLQIDFWSFRSTINCLLERHTCLPTLKAIYPHSIIDPKIWETLEAVIKEKKESVDDYIPQWFSDPTTLEALELGSMKIDTMEDIRDGDTMVGVGNTPQFLIEFHKDHGNKKLNYIQLAISGSPGKIKPRYAFWFQSILTEEGLKNYRSYLKEIGLIGQKHQGRVFFMDIIGSGGGPRFIINEYLNDALNSSLNPEVYMIGINGQDTWENSSQIQGVKMLSLNMDDLAKKLDRIPDVSENASRSIPHFPAAKWEKPFNAPTIPHGKEAESFINKIRNYKGLNPYFSVLEENNHVHLDALEIKDLNLNVSILEERDHNHLNPIQLSVFEGNIEYAQKALLQINPNFEQVQSMLNTLILSDDNIPFCQWLVDMFHAIPDQIEVTDFDKQHTNKKVNLGKLVTK